MNRQLQFLCHLCTFVVFFILYTSICTLSSFLSSFFDFDSIMFAYNFFPFCSFYKMFNLLLWIFLMSVRDCNEMNALKIINHLSVQMFVWQVKQLKEEEDLNIYMYVHIIISTSKHVKFTRT